MIRPTVRDRDLALYGGVALSLAGAFLLRDAWERRGRKRPALMKVFGLVT